MRLRERTVYLKLLVVGDLLDGGEYLRLVRRVEDEVGARFATYRDLVAARAPALPLDGSGAEHLDGWVGGGWNQRARFRLEGEGVARTFELNATSHPYTGRFVTQIDVRVANEHFEDAARVASWVAFVRETVRRLAPVWAHSHETDDNAIQNCTSARLLELGYGVHVDAVDMAANPGREQSRAEMRYCANWLTWMGPELVERLAPYREGSPEPAPEDIDGGWLFQLYPSPLQADTDAARNAQRLLRETAGYDRAAKRERWTWGFWQREGDT